MRRSGRLRAVERHLAAAPDGVQKLAELTSHPSPMPRRLMARYVTRFGGAAHPVGKPYPYIYEEALRRCAPAGRVLAVGDSMAHDVAGANRAGVGSALAEAACLAANSTHYGGASVADFVEYVARVNANYTGVDRGWSAWYEQWEEEQRLTYWREVLRRLERSTIGG